MKTADNCNEDFFLYNNNLYFWWSQSKNWIMIAAHIQYVVLSVLIFIKQNRIHFYQVDKKWHRRLNCNKESSFVSLSFLSKEWI